MRHHRHNGILGHQRFLPLVAALFFTASLTACGQDGSFPKSANGRYEARATEAGGDVHYQVIEVKTGRVVLTTHAEYDTPNDVKAGGFSTDSKKFAAAYHYGHEGSYTWIGVWSTETGELLSTKRKGGWTTSLAGVFNE